jgi:hypothetical protein
LSTAQVRLDRPCCIAPISVVLPACRADDEGLAIPEWGLKRRASAGRTVVKRSTLALRRRFQPKQAILKNWCEINYGLILPRQISYGSRSPGERDHSILLKMQVKIRC